MHSVCVSCRCVKSILTLKWFFHRCPYPTHTQCTHDGHHSCVENQNYYGGYFNNDGNDQGNNNYNGNGQNNGNNYNANGNGQYNDGNYNNGGDGNDFEGMYQQKLVHFKLCPSNSCWRCQNGADYVVELGDYVDAILEAKMTTQEYECEKVRENCYCENAYSEQSCMYNCFKNANLDSCAEDMYEDKFDLQEAVECVQLEADEDALKNYYISHLNSNQQQQAVAYDQNGYYNANGNQNENQAQQGLDKIYVGPCKYITNHACVLLHLVLF